MEKIYKILTILIVIIIIFSLSYYVLKPKPDKISALDGLAIAENRAKQWREDAVLWDCTDGHSDFRENGTCELWIYTFICPSTILYNASSLWTIIDGLDWCEVNKVHVYANGTVFNYSSNDLYPPSRSNTAISIENWDFDTTQAFYYLIDEVGIYSFLDNKMEEWPDSSYNFQTSIHSVNNQTQITISLFIHYWNYSSENFYWRLDGSTGELIETNFINPY